MAKKTGNKLALEKVNYSINIIKDIKEGKEFTQEEKCEILKKYCSTEENNNGYYTPVEICKFMSDCLDVKPNSRIADLSAGIGNMAIPFITEYGKLRDDIIFDLYEYDKNTSIALEKAWEDYEQVNVYGNTDSLKEDTDEKYDYILANPPFTLKTDYEASWNVDKKGKVKKGLNIMEAFVDKIMLSLKPGGVVAIVLSCGFSSRGNATEKCREWLKKNYNLKLVMELDSETFETAGLTGVGVSTLLLIIEKNKTIDNKTIYVEIEKDNNFLQQLNSITYHYKLVQKEHYIKYMSTANDLLYGLLREGIDPETVEPFKEEYEKDIIGKCYCCNKEIEEYEFGGKYKTKTDDKNVLVCFECENDEYMYLTKIKSDLLINGVSYELTNSDKRAIKRLEEEYNKDIEQKKLSSINKSIYLFTNQTRQTVKNEYSQVHLMNMCKEFQSASDENVIKIKYPFIVDCNIHLENTLGLKYINLNINDLNIEHYKAKNPGEKEWNDKQRHIYHGTIKTSCELYDTTFGIFYYPHNKNCSVYINYDYICSKSYGMKKLIEDNLLPKLLGKDFILNK